MTSDNLRFRVATIEDAPQVQQLVQAAFSAPDKRQGWTADMELGARFRIEIEEVAATIAKPGSVILMALVGDDFVASAEVIHRGNGHARLSMLSVDQRHQCGGMGRLVLAHAEAYCLQTWGASTMELNALSTRHKLIAWYQRRGYEPTGETSPFPRDKFSDLALPEDMCFVELEKDLISAQGSVASPPA
ncbi:GNAT family acetyltransferase [Purpureocillium lavendulum]|uniref:GNAT family acetyltransferase n=1 Tax=Purpureocillium lavendulum TaxID=1247861 RepID=A0AB34FXB2_9HYPO|nr:GNAT family acetyltransferase [Purpureocillium lavendulum]